MTAQREWIYKYSDEIGEAERVDGLHPAVRSLLALRGIRSREQIQEFFSEKPQETHDPFLMRDLREAVERILLAVDRNEQICIYGDYDADGVTATSLMLELLRPLSGSVTYYIPSRFDEGYGLNMEAVETLGQRGVKLLITVDCGSVSASEVELAKRLGMDVIVTDHHSIHNSRMADCLLLNPKRSDCEYPFKELAGCGVAFKLAQGLSRRGAFGKAELNRALDLVAIATVGDIVPLIGENRTLVKHGMRFIGSGRRAGLHQLVQKVGIEEAKIRDDQIAFLIVPHLNAAGRMLSAKTGVELLTAGASETDKIGRSVEQLAQNNQDRKRVQEETYQKCLRLVETQGLAGDLFLIVDAGDAHEGIAGIVAGKLKDTFQRPVILVTLTGDGAYLKGTGRSIEGVNLYQLLSENRELFLKFGGHAGACGFSMEKENLSLLRKNLNEQLRTRQIEQPGLLTPKLMIDQLLSGEEASLDLALEVSKMAPFGCGNEKPVFAIKNVTVTQLAKMGGDGQHIRFLGRADTGAPFSCVLFSRAKDYEEVIREGGTVDLAGNLDVNTWNGTQRVQFVVIDAKCAK